LFKRLDDENERQFLWRLGQAKDNGLVDFSWEEIADIMNKEFREDVSEYRSEAAYRKPYQQAKQFYEAGTFSKFSEDTYIAELREAKHEVRKEKQKLWDERTALNKVLREEGRRESMFDIVKYAIEKYQPIKFDYEPHTVDSSDNDLIIHLTDIHCGVNIDSPFNKFNTNILKDRLQRFLNEILDIQRMYQSENAYLILGGDNISGLIHLNARIEAKENIITQIMTVTDMISNFIYELSKVFNKVEVHTTAGNHSRSVANKQETLKGENFDLLVPYICKKDLKNIENIEFAENHLDCDIATFMVRGHMVYATHGDKDTTKNVVYHMTNFARKAKLPLPDMCYLGHRHTNSLETIDDVKVIQSGCVDGMDSYTIDSRLVGTPEQTVTVVTEKHRVKALCDIPLD
jgi:predicted phosphodiesterase